MPKQIAQNVVRQIKQLGEETAGEIVKQPGEMAGQALEQLGVTPTTGGAGQKKPVADGEKAKLAQMEAEDKIKAEKQAARLKKGLEEETKKERSKREGELRQRRQEPVRPQVTIEEKPLIIPASPKKLPGFLGLGQRRQVEAAQQKAQPEKVARRIGG